MSQPSPTKPPIRIECASSAAFGAWLARAGGSLVVSTYQAGKVAVIGWDGARVSLLMREFDKPLGMAVRNGQMVLATRNDIHLLANAPLLAADYLEDKPGRYDALYLPRTTFHTGDLNTHDVAFAGDDLILVNTRFSCLARLSVEHNFTPFWRPSFVTDLVPEDRCHLNGLAMRDGRPRYVTALGQTDSPGAWREKKATGGVVIDVEANEIVTAGLAMPHSPRWHDDRLWVLNSGAGELLVMDPQGGKPEVVCRLPGYLRGLCFVGHHAVVGLCKIREKHIFGGLPVQEQNSKLLCAVAVVDLRAGREVGMFEFTAGCEELYDVHFLPGVTRPMILNLDKAASREAMTNPESSFWLRGGVEPEGEEPSAGGLGGKAISPALADESMAGELEQTGNAFPDSGIQR
ncbi:MAG: TIGR03032 family protein [Pirellulales bacterium]|nr:TIGR03032 family protein [Pirellulales bacterium]